MEEIDFKDLMKKSKLEIQFPDFEENVMESIKEKEASEKSLWKNIRWSWFFFLVGLLLGMIAMPILTDSKLPYFNDQFSPVLLVIEIIIIFLLASQFDNLLRITLKHKKD